MTRPPSRLTINRRKLLAAGSMTLGLAALPFGRSRALSSFEQGPVVDTAYGKLRGLSDGEIAVFRGIPYGADTGGQYRFLPPRPPAPWTHVREAFAFGDSSPQTDPEGMPWWSAYDSTDGASQQLADASRDPDGVRESEDCLYLNVTTPSAVRSARKPVMVWLHGGGYFLGSASWDLYKTENLSRTQDVVVVGINHRLNAFGFTYFGRLLGSEYAASGNVGQLDIVQALQWIRENIAGFGGDPNNVTVFGESGGGDKVCMLMAMPSAKGLFHRGIAESGAFLTAGTIEDADKVAEMFLAELAVKPTQLRALQAMPTASLSNAYFRTMAKVGMKPPSGHSENFGPILDGVVLPRHPFDPDAPAVSADVPLIIGFNHTETLMGQPTMLLDMDEGTLRRKIMGLRGASGQAVDRLLAAYTAQYPQSSPWDRYIYFTTTKSFGLKSIQIAERKAALGRAPVFMYRFDYETTKLGGHLRAMHGLELPFVFNTIHDTAWMVDDTPQTLALATHVSAAWASFARSGDPTTSALPAWPAYNAKTRATMIFNLVSRIEYDPDGGARLATEEFLAHS